MPRLLFTPGKDPVPIVQEAGWAPGPVWTGAENLSPTGIRSLDRMKMVVHSNVTEQTVFRSVADRYTSTYNVTWNVCSGL